MGDLNGLKSQGNTPKHWVPRNTNKISCKFLGNLILTAFLLLFLPGLPIYGFYWLFNYDTDAFIIVFSLSLGALIVDEWRSLGI